MSNVNFQRQTDQPLYPKILWNRPVSRRSSGRLLMVGGHKSSFSDIQAIYQLALAAGIGECHVIVPDGLSRLLAGAPSTSFVPASPSGSLGKGALGEILARAADYDALLLGPNLSNNSESAILAESILDRYQGPVILCHEALPLAKHRPELITRRHNGLIIATMPEVFTLAANLNVPIKIKDSGVVSKVEIMHQVASASQNNYLLLGKDLLVAAESQLSVTSAVSAMDFFLNASIAVSAVWFTQNSSNRFAALTTAAYILAQARKRLLKATDEALTLQEIKKAIEATLAHDDF
jgi:NAD(P)H-hydrate repair Nnr-like enzyme with NAD(P)H-hydrate dehydratase domain